MNVLSPAGFPAGLFFFTETSSDVFIKNFQ
jgi:hypothetical protein